MNKFQTAIEEKRKRLEFNRAAARVRLQAISADLYCYGHQRFIEFAKEFGINYLTAAKMVEEMPGVRICARGRNNCAYILSDSNK